MGSIALAGALTGLGRGMVAQAEYKQKLNFAELEAARQERLAAIQAERDDQREARREASEVARDVRREEHDVSMARTNMEADIKGRMLTGDLQSKQQERGLQAEAEQKRLDRENELKKARIAAGAKGGTGSKNRFETKATASIVTNKDGSYSLGPETKLHTFDKQTGTIYVQDGMKMYPQNEAGKPDKRGEGKFVPIQKDLEALAKNPALANDFLAKFGYLPIGWAQSYISD